MQILALSKKFSDFQFCVPQSQSAHWLLRRFSSRFCWALPWFSDKILSVLHVCCAQWGAYRGDLPADGGILRGRHGQPLQGGRHGAHQVIQNNLEYILNKNWSGGWGGVGIELETRFSPTRQKTTLGPTWPTSERRRPWGHQMIQNKIAYISTKRGGGKGE